MRFLSTLALLLRVGIGSLHFLMAIPPPRSKAQTFAMEKARRKFCLLPLCSQPAISIEKALVWCRMRPRTRARLQAGDDQFWVVSQGRYAHSFEDAAGHD